MLIGSVSIRIFPTTVALQNVFRTTESLKYLARYLRKEWRSDKVYGLDRECFFLARGRGNERERRGDI